MDYGNFQIVVRKFVSIWVVDVLEIAVDVFKQALAITVPGGCTIAEWDAIEAMDAVQESQHGKYPIRLTAKRGDVMSKGEPVSSH